MLIEVLQIEEREETDEVIRLLTEHPCPFNDKYIIIIFIFVLTFM